MGTQTDIHCTSSHRLMKIYTDETASNSGKATEEAEAPHLPFRVAISERIQGAPTEGKLNLVQVFSPNFLWGKEQH